MNPSIFSSWWLSYLSRIYGFCLVTDLHTLNYKFSGIKKLLFQAIFNSGIRQSDVVIVTNKIYRQSILPLNARTVIVPDPLPDLQRKSKNESAVSGEDDGILQILFICSFDPDEPVHEVLAIDSEVDGFEILVTGDWKRMFSSPYYGKHIRFLGFIPKQDYDQLLLNVDGVMVLTREEGCLCCGAYEAFAAGKPVILSRTKALQGFFGNAPVYTDNSSASILDALRILKAERGKRAEMVVEERPALHRKFEKGIEDLEKILTDIKH